MWQPSDNVSLVSEKFGASPEDILSENNYGQNFTAANNLPVLIPVTRLPVLARSPSDGRKGGIRLPVIIGISLGCTLLVVVLAVLLVYVYCLKIKSLNRSASSAETADKLLSGVSGYVSKPTMYETSRVKSKLLNCHISFLKT